MNAKLQSSKKTKAYFLRVILASVLSLTIGIAGVGQTLQAAALDVDVRDVFPGMPFTLDGNNTFGDTMDTTVATSDDNDPHPIVLNDCNSNQGDHSVWYQFSPTTNISLYVDTIGSNYDTLLAVWKQPQPGVLSLVTCNDDDDQFIAGPSKVGFFAKSGTTYYIEVIRYTSPAGSTPTNAPGGNLSFHVEEGFFSSVDVSIGGQLRGSYVLTSGEERREYYDLSGGPVIVNSENGGDIIAAIRLQSMQAGTLYSFVETMGVPSGLLSTKYYFPTYNNTWAPLNSQLRFSNLGEQPTQVRVTIGGVEMDTYTLQPKEERREYYEVSGGPVVVESLPDNPGLGTTQQDIVAAIRLQSKLGSTLYSFSETMGIPVEYVSTTYYFPTYNNTWTPLNSQLRFSNLGEQPTQVRVTIGGVEMDTYTLQPKEERREYYEVSGGPVVVESLPNNPGLGTTQQDIIAAIRLQSMQAGTLYSFVETMGVPSGLLSTKYYFPTYNNTWAPLNSQLRFSNLGEQPTQVRVTIGGVEMDTYTLQPKEERREYYEVSGGPVVVESLPDNPGLGTTQQDIVAAIRLQSKPGSILYSFSETMGIPAEQLSDTYYFPTYNNTWPPLNSQLRFGVP